MNMEESQPAGRNFSRRDFLNASGGGFGAAALAHLLAEDSVQAAALKNPLSARGGHHPAKARAVSWR